MTLNHPRHLNVLVVDDSAVVREVMTAVLSQEPGMKVVTAANPFIAMGKMQRQRPDVIVLDLEMPEMHGLTFLEKVMTEDPIPVIICSALSGKGTSAGIKALEQGAVDIVIKPRLGVQQFLHESAVTLIDAVRAASFVQPQMALRIRQSSPGRSIADALRRKATPPGRPNNKQLLAVGASTGGPEALRVLLQALPLDAPGLVITQHMPEGFTAGFAQRLNEICAITVKEAQTGDTIVAGQALIAPGNRHMVVRRIAGDYVAHVIDGPLVSRHRPSVDVLFHSVAKSVGPDAIGVLMTGMGSDGAKGLLEMRQAGAPTIAQDEASCVIFGMPREAIDRGAACQVVALSKISRAILNLSARHERERAPIQ